MKQHSATAANPSVWDDLRQQREQMERLIADALQQARDLGATAAEVDASVDEGLSVTARLGEVETIERTRDRSLAITVYQGQRKGSASCGDLEPATIRETVERACTIARYTQEDPYCGLADADLMATDFTDLDLCHPTDLSAEAAIERALACEQAGRDYDTRISNSEGATINSGLAVGTYGNTHGFIASEWGTSYTQSLSLIAGKDDAMQRDYWYDRQRDWQTLEDPAITGRIAAERTIARLGARQLKTCSVPVLFTPRMAAGLIGHLCSAAAGSAIYRRSSFLLDRLGDRLFPEWMNIVEQPLLLRGKRSATFDDEGVATKSRALIEAGCLARYILSSYSARRLGSTTTGNAGGVRNLIVAQGEQTQAALVRQMGRGLVVDDVMGQGVNTVTGDYSRGASGFWVEDGEIAYPVHEITIAGQLPAMYAGIIAAANDRDLRTNIQAPSLLVDQMMVAGD